MKFFLVRARVYSGVFLIGQVLLSTLSLAAAESDVVAVSSTSSPDYSRAKSPQGQFLPETFAFAEGGLWAETAVDSSIDKIKFMEVAKAILPALNLQNYVTSTDPKTTKLMIMVYWGKTSIPLSTQESIAFQNSAQASEKVAQVKSHGDTMGPTNKKKNNDARELKRAMDDMAAAAEMAALENKARDDLDAKNASLLGYDRWWNATSGNEAGPLSYRRLDLISELEDRRYFVILMAYDFQLLWKQRKHKLLWETRFSIRDRGYEFDKNLKAMALNASRYFGENTNGLVHKELPTGKIEEGELKVVDDPIPATHSKNASK